MYSTEPFQLEFEPDPTQGTTNIVGIEFYDVSHISDPTKLYN
jgi:hypothetical protein